jgi:two-component system sensor histidine kinase HydH
MSAVTSAMSRFVGTTKTRRLAGPAGIVASVLVISALHYLASTHTILVHEILRRLYYVPIVIAATRYGVQGGLATSLLASALYLPHIVLAWSGWPVFEVGQYGEIVLFNVVGAVTGIMADRLCSERNRYRRASEELEIAYDEIKTSMDERMKAERMATVGRVAAGMAHEIRTPLSAILGCFEILGSDYPADHPKREFLEILKKEIARAEDVVAAFLDFAQPGLPSFQSVDLNDLAGSVVCLVTPALAERAVGPIDVELSQHSVPVTVDAHQLQRALIELLLVGSSLAPQRPLKLSTAMQNSTATVSLVVEGVAHGLSGDLFEPFGASDVPHGLTLPLVRRLIENQGGKVTATRQDRRLEFVIELPTSETAVEAAALPLEAAGS